ncbi:MAG: hypothetical protein KDA58_04155 [Planctomycetaceae bacterium]|nr:hypothetical protein [Planctomycetaceae bacterium]
MRAIFPFLSTITLLALSTESAFAQVQQSYSDWTYEEKHQQFTCTYSAGLANFPRQSQTVVYVPSRPDFFYFYDPPRGGYWGRAATPHHELADPAQPKWSYRQNQQWTPITTSAPTVPGINGGPTITLPKLPAPRFDPNASLDLTEAAAEIRGLFTEHGLPNDWYKTLQGNNRPGYDAGEYRLFQTAIWEMVKPEATRRFCVRYQLAHRPIAELDNGAAISNTPAFEEAMWLAIAGKDHKHVGRKFGLGLQSWELPPLNSRYRGADGAVRFSLIREALSDYFRNQGDLGLDDEATSSDERRRFARVTSGWKLPPGSPPDWAKQQCAWRFVVHAGFVSGEQVILGYKIKGERRLAIDSYLEIGYRRNPGESYRAVHVAGPFHETAYAVSQSELIETSFWTYEWEPPRPRVDDLYYYRDLQRNDLSIGSDGKPLNGNEEPLIPTGKYPRLISLQGGRTDVTNWHEQVHRLLSPGYKPAPKLRLGDE